MPTLLLRLAGPLQAWGSDSKFNVRRTELFPTKSGIIGMIASALGRSREESVEDLAQMQIGIRIDKPGTLIRDFHTARIEKEANVTNRYYLSDAVFLAGIYSKNIEQLEEIESALKRPAYPLFLGRRSCPPDMPLVLGIRNEDLEEALKSEKWLPGAKKGKYPPDSLRIIMEGSTSSKGLQFSLRDQPVSFSSGHRKHDIRQVSDQYVRLKPESEQSDENAIWIMDHDPMQGLEE
jgi:CRISPR system Cascade subunit CasD